VTATALKLLTGMGVSQEEDRELKQYNERTVVLVLAAALAFVGGLIHIGAAVDHYRGFAVYTVAFSCFAILQMTWAALILGGASPRVLLAGCLFQVGIVILWAFSRTTGVPIAPRPWVPEGVGVADVVETLGECMTVIAVLTVVLSERYRIALRAPRAMAPVLLLCILVSVIFGTGAHAG
jgi:hypothetical protein